VTFLSLLTCGRDLQFMIKMMNHIMTMKLSFLSLVLFVLVALQHVPVLVQSRAILGVDMGSLYMKVALVQSGRPIEIVTNLHSKRKTEQMILFDNQCTIRSYGADAMALLQRKAHITPTAMSVMVGRNEQHPTVQVRMNCDWCHVSYILCILTLVVQNIL
jgi:hypothetical protein